MTCFAKRNAFTIACLLVAAIWARPLAIWIG